MGDSACSPNPELRAILEEEALEKGSEYLYDRLQTVDPLSASRILAGNTRRIIRALEVYETTGERLVPFKGRILLHIGIEDWPDLSKANPVSLDRCSGG